MAQIAPFKIQVPELTLEDLNNRLKNTRWTDSPEDAEWHYGTNSAYLKELLEYWQTKYSWRKHEEELNKLPQFTADIEGITVHFIHIKGKGHNSKPLLLSHGWPDSFYRFVKVLSLLTEGEQTFDVVVPSIPGFGFSSREAVDCDRTARLFNGLMTDVLGYQNYYAAGGDIGTLITKSLAVEFPGTVKAIHLTDVGYPSGSEDWSTMSPAEQQFGQLIQQWVFTEGAYIMIQSTKPQTLGYGLNDSPVGLASWILEKLNSWSDSDGNIENSFTKDEILTNIMIYWVTQTVNTSIRTYAENAKAMYTGGLKSSQRVDVPTGVSLFPKEAQFPKEWADRQANIVSFKKLEQGGHFAAIEVPEVYSAELKEFFHKH
ncbi:epoxide hydrolase family protein [Paradesertivirga mongoliensis]|uniref:Epoxide hydrolase family protein n=1 Tax=Paradesertivirga mongoliensis TaxID=2100740 RepID=A0ABW4ZN18_9SPHI|nr:epoxide hydrolase family protein [Pedobacter mongoliensis]